MAAIVLAALAPAAPGFAKSTAWIGGNGDWNDAANWSQGIPALGDFVNLVTNDGIDHDVTFGTSPAIFNLHVDAHSGGLMTLSITQGLLAVQNEEGIGDFGRGALAVSGGSNTFDSSLRVGASTFPSQGTLSISNGGQVSGTTAGPGGSNFIYVGSDGASGTVSIDGAGSKLTTPGGLYIGRGDRTLSDGSSQPSTGNVTITHGGELSVAATTDDGIRSYIGENASVGVLTVDGTGSKFSTGGYLYVGSNGYFVDSVFRPGNGTLNVINGASVSALAARFEHGTQFIVGYGGGTGQINVDGSGSTLTARGEVHIGANYGVSGSDLHFSSGSLNITNGGQVLLPPSGDNRTTTFIGSEGATGAVTVDGNGSLFSAAQYLFIGNSRYSQDFTDDTGSVGALTVTGGAHASSLHTFVGSSGGSGTIHVDGIGSQMTVGAELQVGVDRSLNFDNNTTSPGVGAVTISNGGQLSTVSDVIVGSRGGEGSIVIDGSGSNLTVGGVLIVGGSSLYRNDVNFGDATGTVAVTNGGSLTTTGNVAIGGGGSFGTLTVSDAGSSWSHTGDVYVGTDADGNNGLGTLAISGGSVSVSGTLTMRDSINLTGGALSIGSLNITGYPPRFQWTGGALNITGSQGFTVDSTGLPGGGLSINSGKALGVGNTLTIANDTALTISGGALNAGSIVLNPGASLNFDSGSLNLTNSDLLIGAGGLLGSNLSLTSSRSLSVSGTTTLLNTATLSLDGGSFTTGAFDNSQGGTFVYHAGFISVLNDPQFVANHILGGSGGSTSIAAGSTVQTGSSLTTADNSAITINGGSFIVGGDLTLPNMNVLNVASGGNVNVSNSLLVGFQSTVNVTSGALSAQAVSVQDGGSFTNSSTITASESFVIHSGGFLQNDGTITAPSIHVEAGGLIIGSGTFIGDLVNDGRISVGVNDGEDHVTGNYTQTGSLHISIGGTTPITGFDHVLVDGTSLLDGLLDISLINGFVPTASDTFEFFNSQGAITGLFDNTPFVAGHYHYTFVDGSFDVLYADQSITLTNFEPLQTALPEPGSISVLAMGALMLLKRRRQRRRMTDAN